MTIVRWSEITVTSPTLCKKAKVAHILLPGVGFRSWSRFLAVSLQVTWVINPEVGCHYFLPGLQLPTQPLRGLLPFRCLVNRGTMGANSLPKTVTWQRRGCDLNPGPSAPDSSMLTTRLPSYPTLKASNLSPLQRTVDKRWFDFGCSRLCGAVEWDIWRPEHRPRTEPYRPVRRRHSGPGRLSGRVCSLLERILNLHILIVALTMWRTKVLRIWAIFGTYRVWVKKVSCWF